VRVQLLSITVHDDSMRNRMTVLLQHTDQLLCDIAHCLMIRSGTVYRKMPRVAHRFFPFLSLSVLRTVVIPPQRGVLPSQS
jgi:hypothetical protein